MGGKRGGVCVAATTKSKPGKGSGSVGRGAKLTTAALTAHTRSGGGSSDPDPIVINASPKKKPRLAGTCGGCGQKEQGEVIFVPGYDDRCTTCFSIFCDGFTMHGEWQDFCKLKDDDTNVAANFKEARRTRGDPQTVAWFPHEVSVEDSFNLEVQQSLIGPNRSQLVEALGCTPEECGAKLIDLTDYNGTRYRGMLLPDPAAPYPRFILSSRFKLNNKELAMPREKQLYSAQAEASFAYLKDNATTNRAELNTVMTKARTTPWTAESLLEKANAIRRSRGMPPAPGWPMAPMGSRSGGSADALRGGGSADALGPEELGEAADGDGKSEPGDDDEDPAGGKVDQKCVISGPVLNASLRRSGSADLKGFESDVASVASRASPSQRARVKLDSVSGLPARDEDKQALVDRRIASADAQKILNGVALGREVAWAKHTQAQFQNAGEEGFAKALDVHVKLCKTAEEMTDEPVLKMSSGNYEVRVKELQDAGLEFPTTMKMQMLRRRWNMLLSSFNPADCSLWLSSVLPWPSAGVTGTFDGLKPALAGTEGSVEDKGALFVEGVRDTTTKFINKGSKGVAELTGFCNSLVSFLDKHIDDDAAEAYDAYIGDIMCGARALQCILQPTCFDHMEEVSRMDEAAAKKTRHAKASYVYAVFTALKSNEQMWSLHEDFSLHSSATKAALPDITDMVSKLSGLEGDGGSDGIGILSTALLRLPELVKSCRAGSTTTLENAADKVLRSFISSVGQEANAPTAEFSQRVRSLQQCLENAVRALPAATTFWNDELLKVQALVSDMGKRQSWATFAGIAEEVGAEKNITADMVRTIDNAINDIINLGVDVPSCDDANLRGMVSNIFVALVGYVGKACKTPMSAEGPIYTMQRMSGMAALKPHIAEERARDLLTLGAWAPLQVAVDGALAVSQDPATFAKSASFDSKVKPVLVNLKTLTTGLQFLKEGHKSMKELAGEASKFVDAVFDARMELERARVVDITKVLRDMVPGGDGPKDWTDGVPAEKADDIDFMVEHAHNVFDTIDGTSFANNLTRLVEAHESFIKCADLFEKKVDTDFCGASAFIRKCTVVQTLAIMMYRDAENKKNPNAGRLRRAIRRLKSSVDNEELRGLVHASMWKWIESNSKF